MKTPAQLAQIEKFKKYLCVVTIPTAWLALPLLGQLHRRELVQQWYAPRRTEMRMPRHIADRGASWRDVIATWLVAAVVFGAIGTSHLVSGFEEGGSVATERPILTVTARRYAKVE